jgi:hypothetical protein
MNYGVLNGSNIETGLKSWRIVSQVGIMELLALAGWSIDPRYRDTLCMKIRTTVTAECKSSVSARGV